MPEGPLSGPAVPGHLGLYPRPRGVDQMSQATWARIRGPRGVDQLYRVTRALVRGPPVSTSGPGRLGPGSEDTKSTSCPGELGAVSDIPWTRPAVPGDSGPGRTYCGFYQASWATRARSRGPAVDQLSRATRDCTQGLAGSSRYPGRLLHVSECPRCRQAVLGDSDPGPSARGADQLCRETRNLVGGPVGLSSLPGRLSPGSQGPRGRPAVPGISLLYPRDLGSTSGSGQLGFVSEGPGFE